MTVAISPEKMAIYKRSARAREAADQQAQQQRRERAWVLARQAASLLKDQFGAKRVVVFGSLAHGAWFSARSDIDLLAEGIAPQVFWRAWCALDQLARDFDIELVASEEAAPQLLEMVAREGVEL